MNSKKNVIWFLIVIFIFIFGYLSSNLFRVKCLTHNEQDEERAFQAGWNAAIERYEETNFYVGLGNAPIKLVKGKIVEIKSKKLFVEIKPLEIFADPELDNRTIVIGDATKIVKSIEKSVDQYSKELEKSSSINKDNFYDPEGIVIPSRYIEKEVGVEEIKVGDLISVRTEEDVKRAKQFEAQKITIK